jgi:N,N'-diacetyllegionaminate synthase
MRAMDFGSRKYAFTDGAPPVVIGEIGVNHNGDPALARRLVDVAVEAGVDIVKLQVFKSESEISRFAQLAPYQQVATSVATNQLELCKALELSHSAIDDLRRYCGERKIGFFCSVFDSDSLRFLIDELKLASVKVASGEITNRPFLQEIGQRKVGVILSTGGSTLAEVAEAVNVLTTSGCPELVLLHCVSSYPAPTNEINLNVMQTLRREFRLPVGFSDHTPDIEAAIVATSLGAVAVEKHFTLDRNMSGPDHRASIEPDELKRLVTAVRRAHVALGDGIKRPAPSELENLPLIRRSLVASRSLRKGERLTWDMIAIKRPAAGIAPNDIDKVLGRQLICDLEDDQPITWSSLD